MSVAASSQLLQAAPGGGWWFARWPSPAIAAGMTDRAGEPEALVSALRAPVLTVAAEQVHGGSVAAVGSRQVRGPIPGSDALVTNLPGLALLIRTADCLPTFFADPIHRAIGLAHAGWRGLAAELPARVIMAMRRAYRSRAEELTAAIGPSIRACCYDVGPEFEARLSPFVQEHRGCRTCDLIGAAMAQLYGCGVKPERILDSQLCTACEVDRWFPLRREGHATGRLTSLIVLKP